MFSIRVRCVVLAGAGLFLTAGTASAHHLMGGKIPPTFAEGFLSDVGHPIIGPDHFAFLLALGIAVGIARRSFVNPFLAMNFIFSPSTKQPFEDLACRRGSCPDRDRSLRPVLK